MDQDVLVTNCTQPMPSVPINFDRELVIRSKYVVEDGVVGDGNDEANDHCRTTWTGCTSTTLANQGHWTFGYMMASMAGTNDPTSLIARAFVRDWLKLWLSPQQPNPSKMAAAPRTAIMENLIRPWLNASGCPATATLDSCALDLKKAPFRLLAFVNRIDVPSIAGLSNGGEFFVVFGAIGADPVNCPACAPTQTLLATVTLEYGLPATKSLLAWANQLHNLSSSNPDDLSQTLTYRSNLQALTDAIVGPNASPPSLNHSAIAHVRTHEIAFDCQRGSATCNGLPPSPSLAIWEMRQFKLSGPPGTASGAPLVQDAVSQTPQSGDNRTAAINNQLINNRIAVVNGDPAFQGTAADNALLGNASQSPSGVNAIVWEGGTPPVLNATNAPDLTAAMRAQARHQFGFGTCNGCHYAETANQNGLFHIFPRNAGLVSSISSFLSAGFATNPIAPATTANLAPLNKHVVVDPAGSGVLFSYNEPWRRACEIRRILSGSTTPFTKPTGHLTPPPVCHSTCSTGAALSASCSSCASQICAVDSFCCTNSWDSTCVGEVSSVCGQTCPP